MRKESRAGELRWVRVAEWLVPLALLVFAVLVRLPLLDRPPHIDELFHALAAQSLLEDGDLATLDGNEYSRAKLFTYIVAGSFAMFGENFVAGRLVPLMCGVLLVLALYAVVRRHAGMFAGVAAATMLALDPISIQLAQFTRFYTLHALLFWLGAWSGYRLVSASATTRQRVLHGIVLVVTLLAARHLQATTLIGMVGVGAWMVAILIHRGISTLSAVPPVMRRSPVLSTAVVLVVGAVGGIAISLLIPPLRSLLGGFVYVPRWAMETAGDSRFYLRQIAGDWPLLWLGFPVIALGALKRAPRAASFALTVFLAVVVLHSLAAWKADRYIFYGMPFFFAVCGMGAAWIAGFFLDTASRMLEPIGGARWARTVPAVSWMMLLLTGAFALVQMPGVRRAGRWLTERQPMNADGSPGVGRPDWAAATDSLIPYVARDAEVLTSNDVKAVFYLDRVDGLLHRPEPLNPSPADTTSPYTGRPRIFTVTRLREQLDDDDLTLIVVEASHWRTDFAVPNEVADEIERTTRAMDVPSDWRLKVFVREGQ
ncbi:MAG TPA: glycosyltransferase family 39 protein [Gemmatimonadales bacterium]|nr:glycosyltransferase family 39 protein [Gemmatimonadales bacterium]